MKNCLRKFAGLFSSRNSANSTPTEVWSEEDFRPEDAVETVPDPWAPPAIEIFNPKCDPACRSDRQASLACPDGEANALTPLSKLSPPEFADLSDSAASATQRSLDVVLSAFDAETSVAGLSASDLVLPEVVVGSHLTAGALGNLSEESTPPISEPTFSRDDWKFDDIASSVVESPIPPASACSEVSPIALTAYPSPPELFDHNWDIGDFTAPDLTVVEQSTTSGADSPKSPFDFIDLPEYDPHLNQRLGSEEWAESTPPIERTRARAAAIASLLEISSGKELRLALTWLEDFFERRPAAATFRAIERAGLEGLDLPTLRAMDDLRRVWEERPEYWVTRVKPSPASSHASSTIRSDYGANALSWVAALRICRARIDLPPDEMIDPEWLDEWFAKRSSARSPVSFAEYVSEKVREIEAQDIDAGLRARALNDDPSEWFDHLGADRRMLDPREGRPVSMQTVDVIGLKIRKDNLNG